MPTTSTGSLDIFYEIVGTGPRLLVISGTGGDLRQRPNLLDTPLVDHFTTLHYDQRGLGQSGAPPGAWTVADYGDDAAALLDALGWDDALVLGVSFGGMVAQELAIRHPDRVSRLVLSCTSSGGPGGASYPLHELADLPAEARLALQLELSDTRMDEAWRAEHADTWEALLAFRRDQEAFGADDPARAAGAARQLEARRHHDTWTRLGAITCPTLVAGGRYDSIATPDNLERLAGAIPGAQLAFFDGGHLYFVQDRAAFPTIIAFLLDQPGTTDPPPG